MNTARRRMRPHNKDVVNAPIRAADDIITAACSYPAVIHVTVETQIEIRTQDCLNRRHLPEMYEDCLKREALTDERSE